MLPIVVIAVAIAGLVLLVAWARLHPFLAFIPVSAGAVFARSMASIPVRPRSRA